MHVRTTVMHTKPKRLTGLPKKGLALRSAAASPTDIHPYQPGGQCNPTADAKRTLGTK